MEAEGLRWNEQGLIPAIVQDGADGTVLMVAWMNEEALRLTQARGEAVFWSRSRQAIWHKGETSGNRMRVERIRADCDGDVLLLSVTPAGPACHTGERSCFFREVARARAGALGGQAPTERLPDRPRGACPAPARARTGGSSRGSPSARCA